MINSRSTKGMTALLLCVRLRQMLLEARILLGRWLLREHSRPEEARRAPVNIFPQT